MSGYLRLGTVYQISIQNMQKKGSFLDIFVFLSYIPYGPVARIGADIATGGTRAGHHGFVRANRLSVRAQRTPSVF